MKTAAEKYGVTRNACRVCSPLGASLAFRGVKNAMTILHGSQGCATYIRRYMISHFREPFDVASSSFGEQAAIFGGKENLLKSIENVVRQYGPELIGVATTCLSETIGDDVAMILKGIENKGTVMVPVSTPSYKGSESQGYHEAAASLVDNVAEGGIPEGHVNVFPGMVSPADLRHLKEIFTDMAVPFVMLPDYSETLDGPSWDEYHKIPRGGTSVEEIISTGRAVASIELGNLIDAHKSAGTILQEKFNVPLKQMAMPVGVRGTDALFSAIGEVTGKEAGEKHINERGRLLDAYADGHKYVFGLKALLYGEENLLAGLASFLSEVGITPVLCATGSQGVGLGNAIMAMDFDDENITVMEDADFYRIEEAAWDLKPDIVIGSSKGNKLARKLGIPHVRTGFPIHDRFGGQRILHLGYRGAMELFDRIVNAVLEKRQDDSSVGYMYM